MLFLDQVLTEYSRTLARRATEKFAIVQSLVRDAIETTIICCDRHPFLAWFVVIALGFIAGIGYRWSTTGGSRATHPDARPLWENIQGRASRRG